MMKNMMVICKSKLDDLRVDQHQKDITKIVEKDVTAILDGKTYEQLSELQRKIQAKLSSGEPLDVEYWESLLKNLLVWKARVNKLFL